ncbi:hypothetical protein SAE02_30590 [Skermanella aerolata]|uniref:Uncharacterized protein n=1 Tax=Skermanella aerolata TaxID=393310 RepID=A0A512DR01_9PROT|nr:hypothetical protein SAE02_30590 [Skermanella aerolata]
MAVRSGAVTVIAAVVAVVRGVAVRKGGNEAPASTRFPNKKGADDVRAFFASDPAELRRLYI